jgi:uncharacterized damage-inducible protein DinB
MSISASLLPEFDNEMATTRKCLERVPDDKFAWKPHDRSMPFGDLANHIVEMATWCAVTMQTDSHDISPSDGGPADERAIAANNRELLAKFDATAAAAREALSEASDADYMKPWSLLAGGNVLFTMPKVAVIRTFVFNHIVHHRGQLSVYLRLNDVAVPSIYGPSADEGQM